MTPPRIAVLGWGSLLWENRPDFDNQHDSWRFDGPMLQIEFSRVSSSRHDALTLVIDPVHGTQLQVAYARSKRADPEDAICDLRSREGTTRSNIGFYFADNSRRQHRDPNVAQSIATWAREKKFHVVVWTDLISNFEDVRGEPFSHDAALTHVQSLDDIGRSSAAEYIWRAPTFVDTPLRRVLQEQPWFPRHKRKD